MTGGCTSSLKPWNKRPNDGVMKVIARLTKKANAVPGIRVFMQPAQDINVGGRLARTMFQYTLQDADPAELNTWAPKMLAGMKKLPHPSRRRHRSADRRHHCDADDRPRRGAALQYPAAADRRHAVRRVRPARSDAVFHPAQFLLTSSWRCPPSLRATLHTLRKLYVKSPNGQAVPLSELVKIDTEPVAPLAVNHQSQFPAVTISFNLAPGASLGRAVQAIDRCANPAWGADSRCRDRSRAPHRRSSPHWRQRALSDRGGAHRGLHHPRHPV